MMDLNVSVEKDDIIDALIQYYSYDKIIEFVKELDKRVANWDYTNELFKFYKEENEKFNAYSELEKISEEYGGNIIEDSIRIDTNDNTSKENYDDLILICSEISGSNLKFWKISDKYADHNTQIIYFERI